MGNSNPKPSSKDPNSSRNVDDANSKARNTDATVDDLNKAGQRHYDAKDYNRAIPYFNESIKRYPESSSAYGGVGWSYFMLKDYSTALENFKTLVRLAPANHSSHVACGNCYFMLKEYPRAMESFKEAFRLKRDEASYCSARGWCYYFLDDYQRALEVFNEALDVNATCTNAYDGRGWVYYNLGRYPLAMTEFDTSLRLDPLNKNAYNGRGWVYETINDFARATADFNESIRLDSEFHYPYNGRGYVYYRLGEYSKAIEDFKKAIRLDLPQPNAFRNLGLTYLKMGQQALALENIEKAIALKPNYAHAYTARGEYFSTMAVNEKSHSAKQTYYRKAEAEYKTALQISFMAGREKEETEAGLQTVAKALETLSASAAHTGRAASAPAHSDPFEGFSTLSSWEATTSNATTDQKSSSSAAFQPSVSDPFAEFDHLFSPPASSKATTNASSDRASDFSTFRPTPIARDPAELVKSASAATTLGEPVASLGLQTVPFSALTLGRILGEGGFGIVYQGTWRRTDVAIKQLKVASLSASAVESFLQEARQHAMLRHPHIVALFSVCVEVGHYSMVMEYMPQGSLYDVLRAKEQVLPWSLRLTMARHIAIGLAYLHDQSILHRDLKSLNVLLDNQMNAKLSDFGLSKEVKKETSSTMTSVQPAVGSILWMAPELFKRGVKYDTLSDVYALGIVFWELSSRKLPFQDDETATAELIKDWVKDGEREVIPSDTPPAFAALITRCWAQRTGDRPANVGAVLDALSAPPPPPAIADSGYRMHSRN